MFSLVMVESTICDSSNLNPVFWRKAKGLLMSLHCNIPHAVVLLRSIGYMLLFIKAICTTSYTMSALFLVLVN